MNVKRSCLAPQQTGVAQVSNEGTLGAGQRCEQRK